MNKHLFSKVGLVAGLMAMVLVNQAHAVDTAAAAGIMAEVESLAVSAKANLAEAALSGNVDAVAEAGKRSDAIDAGVAAAKEAYAAMERALANGDEDAAESAEDDLASALKQVKDALTGAIPDTVAGTTDQWKASKTNTGGGPGHANDPPNIYDVPWKSQGIRAYYQSLFGVFHNASGFGHGRGFGDRDATPE